MNRKAIVRVVSKVMIPFILMFGFYTQFHGDFGPGGGFQAGVILAAAFLLYGLVFGLKHLTKVAPIRWVEFGVALGVLVYAGTGVISLLLGGNFLDYNVLDGHDPHHGQHRGIFWVEVGVGITVTSVMIAIFQAFAGFRREVSS